MNFSSSIDSKDACGWKRVGFMHIVVSRYIAGHMVKDTCDLHAELQSRVPRMVVSDPEFYS